MTSADQNLEKQWQKFFSVLMTKEPLGQLNYANIKLLKPKAIMGSILILAAPNDAVRKKVEEKKVYDVLKSAVQEVFDDVTPHIIIEEVPVDLTPSDDGQLFDIAPQKTSVKKANKQAKLTRGKLNPKYTFDNFIWGPSNRFAYSAAVAVAERPADQYNPLFIWGRSGLGKTHLLHAIGHYALNEYKDEGIKVLYVNSEEYTNDFINSIGQEKAKKHFKDTYRNVDILLVDDIQFLAKKDTTQEEFFHTFNALLSGSKQVVITCDVHPKDLHSFGDRLRSRFEQGLLVDVLPPNLETRIAILRQKTKMEKLKVPDDVIELIASKISTNIRELEGALIRVSAYADLTDVPLDLHLTQTILKEMIQGNDGTTISLDKIIRQTAAYFEIPEEEIRGHSRVRSIAYPRQVAMYLCRELSSDVTLALIGKEFGNRDHTTVMHAVKRITESMKTDKKIYDEIAEVTTYIKEK